jgi:hypothetical protein
VGVHIGVPIVFHSGVFGGVYSGSPYWGPYLGSIVGVHSGGAYWGPILCSMAYWGSIVGSMVGSIVGVYSRGAYWGPILCSMAVLSMLLSRYADTRNMDFFVRLSSSLMVVVSLFERLLNAYAFMQFGTAMAALGLSIFDTCE